MADIRKLRAGERDYTVVMDAVRTFSALVAGAVRDEITGAAPPGGVRVRASRGDVAAKVTPGGAFTAAGYAERLFDTAGGALDFELRFSAPGYRDEARTYHVPQGAALPVSVPAVLLRRTPVRLRGRVVEDTSARPPVPDALVTFVGGPSPGEKAIALRTPLGLAHAAGIVARRCQFAAAGAARQLLADAPAGSRWLHLSSRAGLSAGTVLRLGADATAAEYAVVEALDPLPADPNAAGRVRLTAALRRGSREGAVAQEVTPAVSGPDFHLTREADAGDGLVLLDAAPAAEALRFEQPPSPLVEYAAVGALTDAEGFYRLDGVGRVAALDLDVRAAGFSPLAAPVPWTVAYGGADNRVDFRIS